MGYYTEFQGCIDIDRALSEEDEAAFNKLVHTRHDHPDRDNVPGYYCDWSYSVSPRGEFPNITAACGKNYSAKEWLDYLICKFFKPRGYVLNGEVECFGECSDDIWKMVVENNVMKIYEGNIEWSDVGYESTYDGSELKERMTGIEVRREEDK